MVWLLALQDEIRELCKTVVMEVRSIDGEIT